MSYITRAESVESVEDVPSSTELKYPDTRYLRPKGWSTGDPWTKEDMVHLNVSYIRQLNGRSLGVKDITAYDAFKRRWGHLIHIDNLVDIRN